MSRTLIRSIFIFFITILPISAAEFYYGKDVVMGEPRNNDSYVLGENVTVQSFIKGDLVAIANFVRIKSDILEDLIVISDELELFSMVKDDALVLARQVDLDAQIMGDFMDAGMNLRLARGAVVHGDLVFAGSRLDIYGNVKGNLIAYAGTVNIQGNVDGHIHVEGGDVIISGNIGKNAVIMADSIRLDKSARFLGDVDYFSQEGAVDFTPCLTDGKSEFRPELGEEYSWRNWSDNSWAPEIGWKFGISSYIISLLSGLFTIFIWLLLFPNRFRHAAGRLSMAPVSSIGLGFLYVLFVPVLIFLLVISIVGIPLSLFVGFFYLFTILFSRTFAAVLIAMYIDSKFDRVLQVGWLALIAFGIFLFAKMLGFLPVLGWAINIIISVAALGALIYSGFILRAQKEDFHNLP